LRYGVALALVCLLQQDAQQPPKFKSGVDVVLLDVTVLDKDRRPVRGLKAADFSILEDGKPQPIVSFDELDAPEPDGSLVPWMRETAPDVRTNADEGRRLIIMVLDDANISFKYRDDVKRIGRAVVDRIGPADQMVVIYTGNNARSQEFTNDRKLLRQAVERYVDTTVSRGPGLDLGQRYAIDTLDRSVETLLAVPHRRKALIFVSSLAIDLGADAKAIGAIGIGSAASTANDIAFRVAQMLRRAQQANVSIFPVNPAGLAVMAEPGPDLIADTAYTLANQTGGFAVTNTTAFEPQIKQIFRETGSYYLLGFSTAHQDGKFRRVGVRVNRPGLEVRTRNGYTALDPTKEGKQANVQPLIKAVSSVLPDPDVPVRVSAAAFATPGNGLATVAITIGVQQPAPATRIPEHVEVVSTAIDTEYKSRALFRQSAQMMLRPVDDGTDAKYEILSKLSLKPGRYQLRFAVHSTLMGKSGSVFQDIEVPDFASADISLSGVVLSVDPALPSAPKGLLSSVVPFTPTTQRVFMSGHRAAAFVRVYQGGKGAQGATLTTRIIDQSDEAVFSSTQDLSAEEFGPGGVDHRFELPFGELTPGAYLLRFVASRGKTTVTRDVRFSVR
jgi:VWFA-related protein